jgi:hypothetical protein
MSSKKSQSEPNDTTAQKPLSQQYADVVRLRKAVTEAERIAWFVTMHIPDERVSGRTSPDTYHHAVTDHGLSLR